MPPIRSSPSFSIHHNPVEIVVSPPAVCDAASPSQDGVVTIVTVNQVIALAGDVIVSVPADQNAAAAIGGYEVIAGAAINQIDIVNRPFRPVVRNATIVACTAEEHIIPSPPSRRSMPSPPSA